MYNGIKLGNFGLMGTFSTYFGHHISTIEGGVVSTNDEEMNNILLSIRSHGWDRDLPLNKQKELRDKYSIDNFSALYNFYVPGFNLRATDLQAFIGLRAIDKLDRFAENRNNNFKYYMANLKNNELNLRNNEDNFISNFAIPVVSKDKKTIVKNLMDNQIECRPLIAGDLSQKPFWYDYFEKVHMENCSKIDEFGFYIPNHQDLTKEQIDKIIKIVNNE
jgi:CDP-6-deoxy-D-xylo-4-hexulose-3-dehydrase